MCRPIGSGDGGGGGGGALLWDSVCKKRLRYFFCIINYSSYTREKKSTTYTCQLKQYRDAIIEQPGSRYSNRAVTVFSEAV